MGGEKSAMRAMQAFMCIIEGETLSINFLFMLIFFVQSYYVYGYNQIFLLVPLRSIGIIFMFTVLDAIQDFVAVIGAYRFSNFSYMFCRDGWHSKLTLPYY